MEFANLLRSYKILGKILGTILGKTLGTILGKILGTILGKSLGTILGKILGTILGKILGQILQDLPRRSCEVSYKILEDSKFLIDNQRGRNGRGSLSRKNEESMDVGWLWVKPIIVALVRLKTQIPIQLG